MNKQEKKKQVAEIAQQLHDIICADNPTWNENTRNSKPTGYFLVLADDEGSWTSAQKIDRGYVIKAVLRMMEK